MLNSHKNPAFEAIMWIRFLHFLACADSTWLRCRRRATPWRSSLARTSSASSFNKEIFACRVALEAWLHGLSTGTLKKNFVRETQPINQKILYIVCLLYGYCMALSMRNLLHKFTQASFFKARLRPFTSTMRSPTHKEGCPGSWWIDLDGRTWATTNVG